MLLFFMMLLILASVTTPWGRFCSFLLTQHWSAVTSCWFLFSYFFAHLTVFLSFPVGQLPPIVTRCVCARAGGVSTVLCGRPSWITQTSCLAWIGIWFHFSLISGSPFSAHFVPYHATSCWMRITKCASKSHHIQTWLQPHSSVDNARAFRSADSRQFGFECFGGKQDVAFVIKY